MRYGTCESSRVEPNGDAPRADSDRLAVTRYIALLQYPAPLGALCRACGELMDDSGCRIGDHFVRTSPTGITQVVEVFCEGTPTIPVQECPACR